MCSLHSLKYLTTIVCRTAVLSDEETVINTLLTEVEGSAPGGYYQSLLLDKTLIQLHSPRILTTLCLTAVWREYDIGHLSYFELQIPSEIFLDVFSFIVLRLKSNTVLLVNRVSVLLNSEEKQISLFHIYGYGYKFVLLKNLKGSTR
jgi:hypothetical protein